MSMLATFKKQFPTGLAWVIPPGYIRKLITGLAVEQDRLVTFLEGIVRASNPGTATETQPEWFEQYGIAYPSGGPIENKQAQTLARYTALGGQDIVYIQNQVDNAGFSGIIVGETVTAFSFSVTGTLTSASRSIELQGVLEQYTPGHLVPDYTGLTIDNNVYGSAVCGVGTCSAT